MSTYEMSFKLPEENSKEGNAPIDKPCGLYVFAATSLHLQGAIGYTTCGDREAYCADD
jgi:hypothetical protein